MRDVQCMRTTVNIDDDVLRAARELANLSGKTLGEVLSDLARTALVKPGEKATVRNGVPLLRPSAEAGVVTSEDIDRLLEEP